MIPENLTPRAAERWRKTVDRYLLTAKQRVLLAELCQTMKLHDRLAGEAVDPSSPFAEEVRALAEQERELLAEMNLARTPMRLPTSNPDAKDSPDA